MYGKNIGGADKNQTLFFLGHIQIYTLDSPCCFFLVDQERHTMLFDLVRSATIDNDIIVYCRFREIQDNNRETPLLKVESLYAYVLAVVPTPTFAHA
ncbi:hypothetical protein ACJX0J_021629, partial [Zea mays]